MYLKINGVNTIEWKDIHQKINCDSAFKNTSNIMLGLFLFPFLYLKVRWLLFKVPTKTQHYNFSQHPCITYLRTDHWFNLTSGGSVGHVSGVVNELQKLKLLDYLVSTDSLYEISTEIHQTIESPNYYYCKNIPDFAALHYNSQLCKLLKNNPLKNTNTIYQRLSLGNFNGILLKYFKKIPLIIEYNGSEIWASEKWGGRKLLFSSLYKKIEISNLLHADLIVVVSEPLKEELMNRGIDENRILINPNGVSLEKFDASIQSDTIRIQYHLEGKKVFGFIGTFAEWHGVVFLVESIVSFYSKNPKYLSSVRFLLIGSGNLLNKTKQIIQANNLNEQVIFTNRIDQHLAPEYLAACDYFVSPHIPNPDGSKFFGSPTKLFEYMSLKKPIIASDLNQIGEILRKHEAALLINPGDSISFIAAMTKLLEDPQYASHIANNAYNAVLNHYTWKKHVLHIIEKTQNFNTPKIL